MLWLCSRLRKSPSKGWKIHLGEALAGTLTRHPSRRLIQEMVDVEKDREIEVVIEDNKSDSPRKRKIWLCMLLGAVIVIIIAGTYAYLEITAMIEDLGRLWHDVVQLFWLIVPNKTE